MLNTILSPVKQGNPNVIKSADGISSTGIFVTSSHTTCALLHPAYVSHASLYKSFAQITLKPALWNPMSIPPAPQKRLTPCSLSIVLPISISSFLS